MPDAKERVPSVKPGKAKPQVVIEMPRVKTPVAPEPVEEQWITNRHGQVVKKIEENTYVDERGVLRYEGGARVYGTMENLKSLGVTPMEVTTCRQVCRLGWAPAPANEYQKAVWEELHAIPTEPIKIKPEEKKVDK